MKIKIYRCEFTTNDQTFYACNVSCELYAGICVFNSHFDREWFLFDLISSLSKYTTHIDLENNKYMDEITVINILAYYFNPLGLVSNIKDKQVFIKRW